MSNRVLRQGGRALPAIHRFQRNLPVGAECQGKGVSFRVWAPKRQSVEIGVSSIADFQSFRIARMQAEEEGYFTTFLSEAAAGTFYGFRLDGEPTFYPDPASRFQPFGPRGPSQVIDPRSHVWHDKAWNGLRIAGQVIYELHVGTFTQEGNWRAAADRLADLADMGMTVVEVMPVADFPGEFGWGYDGVYQFAPTRLYGTPDDFRRFIDRAHGLGLGVILDVVYNHFGSFGNDLIQFSDDYLSKRYDNEWGSPINFDDANCGPVRDYFLANVRYWIEEFHLDGFRFDATQQIFDSSPTHILAELQSAAREAASPRSVILLAENEPQHVRLVQRTASGGIGFDALSNDDFHHAARVCVTGLNEAYYSDYGGTAKELRSAIQHGYLYQGQYSRHQGKRRGTDTRELEPTAFVHFLQNHDQVANSGTGERIDRLTSPGRLRALTALWLLSPQTPLFFQGQEFAASAPFLYFADFPDDEGKTIAQGRIKFLSQFPSLNTPEAVKALPCPSDPETFRRSKLDWSELQQHGWSVDLHRDLLTLRKSDPLFRRQRADLLEASTLNDRCVIIRFFAIGSENAEGDRLVIANFGSGFDYWPCPEPLLAPPAKQEWKLLWSSECLKYGGQDTPRVETPEGWHIPAEATVVLRSVQSASWPHNRGGAEV